MDSATFLTSFLDRYPQGYRRALTASVSTSRTLRSAVTSASKSVSASAGDVQILRAVYAGVSSASRPAAPKRPAGGKAVSRPASSRPVARGPKALPGLRFVAASGLSATGLALLQALRGANAHDLDESPYDIPGIEARLAAYRRLARDPARSAPSLRPKARSLALWAAIEKLGPRRRAEASAVAALLRRLIHPKESPIAELPVAFDASRRAQQRLVARGVELELALAAALLRHSRALGRDNLVPTRLYARWSLAAKVRRQSLAAGKTPREARLAVHKALSATSQPASAPLVLRDPAAYLRGLQIEDLRAVVDVASLRRLLRASEPPHPQYRKLLPVLARYRAIVAKGGWGKVRRVYRLRLGYRHRRILALKRRLAVEGYYQPKSPEALKDRRVDEALRDAVERFQHAHQLVDSGRPSPRLFRALNVSAERRLAAIRETLGRWRNSAVGASVTYLRVDVPDFHLELWHKGKRLARHRVVVGRAQGTKCDDETKRRVLRFATPLQSALLDHLIFAPFWNVTPTIKQTELDPERAKDGLFYEKHGYEVLRPGTRHEWVRQLPGPGNSLGFVKFIFPNPHATFVHDTPEKKLFERPRRAFSHGCMRVQNAWSLAKVVLNVDGQWRERDYRKLYKDWREMGKLRGLRETWDPELYESLREKGTKLERKVPLRKSIPVHVEYTTVRVADDGGVRFHGDVYGLAGRKLRRVGRRCVPEKKLARRGFAEMPTKVAELEKRALAVAPELLRARGVVQLLSPKKRRRHYWLVRQIEKKLGRFTEHHANLARSIRTAHGALEQSLVDSGNRWRARLVERAVALQRLLVALEHMTARAERVCKLAARLAPKAATKRP